MTSDGPISFARGAPSTDIVPAEELRACADRALRKDEVVAALAAYGNSAGYMPLRKWIADYYKVQPDQVLVTNGSMQADAFLFSQLVDAGDVAVVEAPTYDRTLLMLRELEAQVVAVPMQADGIDVGGLREIVGASTQPSLLHIIPNFHNPAGCTLSEEKRREIVELAATHNFTVLEDDPYAELDFGDGVPPRLLDIDASGKVVYASTFSKTAVPGARVGYLIGAVDVIEGVTELATHTYIMPGMLAQAVIAEFCESGMIFENIERVKQALHVRRDALADALSDKLPDFRFVLPQGGYFLWAEFPEDVAVADLFDAARQEGVAFVKGTDFFLEGGEHALRLAFSGVTPEQIVEGVDRLARAFEAVRTGARA